MEKTGGPYLESGESIILTTDRVRVNSVQYEVMLTTRNLILVDAGNIRFQPSMYPLLSILSVKGGKTANGELVISLFFNETRGNDESGPMVLVFSPQPGEQRKSERDEWIKKLMKLIVSVRQETNENGNSPADQKNGIQPSFRRTFAPEMSIPYKSAPDTRPAHVEFSIIPDEADDPALFEGTEPEVIPGTHTIEESLVEPGQVTESPVILSPELTDTGDIPVESDQVTESPVILSSELMDTGDIPVESDQVTESPVILSPELMDTGDIPVESDQGTESPKVIASPEERDTGTSTDTQENAGSIVTPGISAMQEIPTISKKDTESPDLLHPPKQIFIDSPSDSLQDNESPETKTPQASAVQESFQRPATDTTPPPEKAPPAYPHPAYRRRVVIAVTAIIIIIPVIAGAGMYYSATSAPPVTEPAPIPTTTLLITPVPTPVIIPTSGVWVRVEYPGNFYGWLGAPGSLRRVNSSGDQIYRMPESAGTIQVNMYKVDNSRNSLTVEVYREGIVINNRTISVPMGSVELLIDAKTGNPPGLTPLVTQSDNQTGSGSGRIMYF